MRMRCSAPTCVPIRPPDNRIYSPMALILFLVLIGIPVVELYVLISVGGEIGAPATVGLVLFTAALGIWLVRLQPGAAVLRVGS